MRPHRILQNESMALPWYTDRMHHVSLKIAGLVQGVCFRSNAERRAHELGVTGFVRNEPDGSVFLEAEGKEEALAQFITWCHQGPRAAQVKNVIVNEGTLKGYTDFEIRYA